MSEVIERLQRQVDQHEERLVDHLKRLGIVEAESERTRKRLHRMENDRRAVQALVRTTQALADQTRALGEQAAAAVRTTEELAERAAERALTKAHERRAASRWRRAGRIATHLASIAAFGSLVAYMIHTF